MSTMARFNQRWGNSTRELLIFGMIGGSGVLVNLLVIALCHNLVFHTVGWPDDMAVWNIPGTRYSVRLYHVYALVAFFVANLYNYLLNRHLNFRGDQKAPFLKEFVPFLAVGMVAQAVGLVILTLLRNPTSPFYLPDPWFTDHGPIWTKRLYWAQLIQVILVMPINFVVNKLWTFRLIRRRHHARTGQG